jgi:hypothetical protein
LITFLRVRARMLINRKMNGFLFRVQEGFIGFYAKRNSINGFM